MVMRNPLLLRLEQIRDLNAEPVGKLREMQHARILETSLETAHMRAIDLANSGAFGLRHMQLLADRSNPCTKLLHERMTGKSLFHCSAPRLFVMRRKNPHVNYKRRV